MYVHRGGSERDRTGLVGRWVGVMGTGEGWGTKLYGIDQINFFFTDEALCFRTHYSRTVKHTSFSEDVSHLGILDIEWQTT